MDVRKATRQDLKLHNRLTLLRAVYYGLADNRAALAGVTGLAKPTVSDLIGELIADGLLAEGGQGEANEQGGKRPRLLEFVPDSRQVIGVSILEHRIIAVLCNLDGRIIAEHEASLNGATGDTALIILGDVINGLVAQLDAPLLAIGIGVPGVVNRDAGVVQHSEGLGWQHFPLIERLQPHYDCPITLANNTELVALAQFAFRKGTMDGGQNLVTLLVNSTTEIGVALRGAHYHHGGDIGSLRVMPNGQPLDAYLGWQHVRQCAEAWRTRYPETMLPEKDLTYMHIRYAAANSDPLALALYDDLADTLARVVAWAIALLHPHHLSLTGEIADLDQPLVERVKARTAALFDPEAVADVLFSLVDSPNLSALGAAAQAIHQELDIL